MTLHPKLMETAHDWLRAALDDLDGPALLTSPYITYPACRRIAKAANSSQHKVVLVTALDPRAAARGSLQVDGLRLLLKAGVEVRDSQRVHAKCFILGSRAMLGSANLTQGGLGGHAKPNYELGVELDVQTASEARQIIDSWPSTLVSEGDLDVLERRAAELTWPVDVQSGPPNSETAPQISERLLADARDPGRELWLKLEYDEPYLDWWRAASYFASSKRGKPSFRPGDLVIICAKATGDCYSIVEVVSEPEFQPLDYRERWDEHDEDDQKPFNQWPWVTRTTPRLVPPKLMDFKRDDLGVKGQGLQNGHVRLKLDQFAAAVRALERFGA